MAYDLIKISALPAATPDESQEIVVGVGDLAKRINYGDVKADMVGTSPTYTTDTEPYLMRQTAHTGVVGKCALNKLVGGSLGWNQLVADAGRSSNGITTTFSNGVRSLSGSTSTTWASTATISHGGYKNGHVYYHSIYLSANPNALTLKFVLVGTDAQRPALSITAKNVGLYGGMAKSTITTSGDASSGLEGLTSGTNLGGITFSEGFYNLTQMFGSTIADYVYGLESATAGAGVAWLSKYIDLGTYHAYDAGSIQSVQATEHVTLSKNFLTDYEGHGTTYTISGVTFTQNSDGTITLNGTATAAVTYYLAVRQRNFYLPKGSYILSGTPTGYIQYTLRLGINRGADGATIGNDLGSGFAFTEATGETYGVWIAFDSGAVFNNVVMKPMIRFATADSTYVPYQKHTYPLGSDTLRGVPQLVSNKLSYDGDIKTPDGTIKRKYGIVDLGSLTYTGDSGGFVLSASIGAKVQTTQAVMAKIICSKYPTIMQSQLSGSDKCVYGLNWGNGIGFRDSAYNTPAAFKTAMSGVYLVYELATETTESSTAYQKVQTIDADGTESFTTSTPVPVGHETQTPDNVLAALEWLGE